MNCKNPACGKPLIPHKKDCVVCGHDGMPPNVRVAYSPDEIRALEVRVSEAKIEATRKGYSDVLKRFETAMVDSKAVVCLWLSQLQALISSDNAMYQTYYQAIRGESRLPEDNRWDRIRQVVDEMIFPYYKEDIRFGALTLTGEGVSGYGDCAISLTEISIRDRASVFEKNTITFVKENSIPATDPIPSGYRAPWANRADLAIAKLAGRLDSTTIDSHFQSILIDSVKRDGDFIEVHIFGPIHHFAFSSVILQTPARNADKVILRSVQKKLENLNIDFSIK